MTEVTTAFKRELARVAKVTKLAESEWGDEAWSNLIITLTQDTIDDAHAQNEKLHRLLFADTQKAFNLTQTDFRVTQRPRKKRLSRVAEKYSDQRVGRENYFKVVSDLLAVRVVCRVTQIPSVVSHLAASVVAMGGIVHVRGESEEHPFGSCWGGDGKFTDITQHVYVFLEEVGYPVEVKIGHAFAVYTFDLDSSCRQSPRSKHVDFWAMTFYFAVKEYLLRRANGVGVGDVVDADDEVETESTLRLKAKELYRGNVPAALDVILTDIFAAPK